MLPASYNLRPVPAGVNFHADVLAGGNHHRPAGMDFRPAHIRRRTFQRFAGVGELKAAQEPGRVVHSLGPVERQPVVKDMGLEGIPDRVEAVDEVGCDPRDDSPNTLMPAYGSTAGLYRVRKAYENRSILTDAEIEQVVNYLSALK